MDNNCDGAADDIDADADGFTVCDDDCDDADASIHPGAEEICDDDIDNDCDGGIDEDCAEGDDDDDDTTEDIHPNDDDTVEDDPSAGGCDCRVDGRDTAGLGGLLLMALAVLVRRRT